jgi:hypothetical protein
MLLSCGSRMRAKTLHTICRRNAVKWLASETTHRHDPAFRCPLSYSRASTPSSTPMCKPTNTPMRSMSGKRLIMGHQLSPAAVSPSPQPHYYRRAEECLYGQAIIAQPMNGGTNALQLKTVLFRVQPSMPPLAKTILGHPPLAAVLLGSQTCGERRRLVCHRAIALVENGKRADWRVEQYGPSRHNLSQRLAVGLEGSARTLAAKPNWITSTRSNC